MGTTPTEEQVEALVEKLEDFLQVTLLKRKLNLDKMQEYMEPWFAKFGYRRADNRILDADKPQTNVLILQDSPAIGDFISTTPVVREIRRIYQDAFITFLISEQTLSLAENCPYVDEILTVNRNYNPSDLKEIYEWNLSIARKIMHRRYDIAFAFLYDLDFSTVLLAYMAGARERVSNVVGKNEQFTPLLTKPAPEMLYGSHAIDNNLSCLDHMLGAPVSRRRAEIWCGAGDVELAKSLLKGHDVIYAVCTGGSHRKKHYPPERYARLINMILADEDVFFVVLGGKEDEEEAAAILAGTPEGKAMSLAGKLSLLGTAAVISLCRYCISNDTGMVHMAAALGIPVVMPVCFPADVKLPFISTLQRWYPYGVPSVIVQPANALPECKESKDFLGCLSDCPHCITQISAEAMYEAFQILKRQVAQNRNTPTLCKATM